MEYQNCYIHHPTAPIGNESRKRRRIDNHGLQSSWTLRRKAYEHYWYIQRPILENQIAQLNESLISSVSSFVQDPPEEASNGKLPAAIIVTGPDLSSQVVLFEQLATRKHVVRRSPVVCLTSNQAPNLKTLLKHLISRAASQTNNFDDDEDDDEVIQETQRKHPRLLNYDLQILHNAVEEQGLGRVVVCFQDCEAFDGCLMSDAIDLLSSWRDRIPFVLVFGVATSIESLQAKLSRRAIRCISGRRFDTVQAEEGLEILYQAACAPAKHEQMGLWLGSNICSSLLTRQRDNLQSLQAFIDSCQYAYMTALYANALNLFLYPTIKHAQVPDDHFEAVRNLSSFHTHVFDLIENQRRPAFARDLLEDDKALYKYLLESLRKGHRTLLKLTNAVNVLHSILGFFPHVNVPRLSDLHVQALAGELQSSPMMRTLLLAIRRSSSDNLFRVLATLHGFNNLEADFTVSVKSLFNEIETLLSSQKSGEAPLRSEEDIQNSTLRTTVVAKKVELSKAKSTLTKGDTAYTSILTRFVSALEDYMSHTLINPKDLPFHEIFLYDLRSPHREVFTPKPRFAIERALSAPHDYLDCDCCLPGNGEEASSLSATQPPTAILYQLYLESGALINASDLRSAFAAIIGEKVEDEALISALFQRSLAELRFMGLVKGTKKKADHVLKLAWKGV